MKIITDKKIYEKICREVEIETDKGVRLKFTLTTVVDNDSDYDDDNGAGYDFGRASQEIYDALTDEERDEVDDFIMTL